jgi:anti-anti-sigma factor
VLISIDGAVAVAYCAGTLDRRSVEELSERLRSLVFSGVRGVVCSLERVEHVHFQALDRLVDLHRLLRAAGGRLVLAGASPYVRQILDFGGIPAQLDVVDGRLEAMMAMRLQAPGASGTNAASVQPSLL